MFKSKYKFLPKRSKVKDMLQLLTNLSDDKKVHKIFKKFLKIIFLILLKKN